MTYQEWQMTARNRLRQSGLDERESALVARKLLDFHTQVARAALLFPEETVQNPAELETLLARLERGEPLPHILRAMPFWEFEFQVSSDTLIPRPETELLVEAVLERLENRQNPRICDLGTGSGAIAITLAKVRGDAQICAVELCDKARAIAEQNARQLGATVQFVAGAPDWFSPLETHFPAHKWDVLVSNPPYIASAEIETLATSVREFEPRLALDGGADGLEPYRVFAARGRDFLNESGFFALELGARQFGDVAQLFRESGWRVEAPTHDLAGIERVLVAHNTA